jgi:hypothetical protein
MSETVSRAYTHGVAARPIEGHLMRTLEYIREGLEQISCQPDADASKTYEVLRSLVHAVLAEPPAAAQLNVVALRAETDEFERCIATFTASNNDGAARRNVLEQADRIMRRLSLGLCGQIWLGIQPQR